MARWNGHLRSPKLLEWSMSVKNLHRRALWEEEVALPTEEVDGVGWDGLAMNDCPQQHVQAHLQLLLALCHACRETGDKNGFIQLQQSWVYDLRRCITLWHQTERRETVILDCMVRWVSAGAPASDDLNSNTVTTAESPVTCKDPCPSSSICMARATDPQQSDSAEQMFGVPSSSSPDTHAYNEHHEKHTADVKNGGAWHMFGVQLRLGSQHPEESVLQVCGKSASWRMQSMLAGCTTCMSSRASFQAAKQVTPVSTAGLMRHTPAAQCPGCLAAPGDCAAFLAHLWLRGGIYRCQKNTCATRNA